MNLQNKICDSAYINFSLVLESAETTVQGPKAIKEPSSGIERNKKFPNCSVFYTTSHVFFSAGCAKTHGWLGRLFSLVERLRQRFWGFERRVLARLERNIRPCTRERLSNFIKLSFGAWHLLSWLSENDQHVTCKNNLVLIKSLQSYFLRWIAWKKQKLLFFLALIEKIFYVIVLDFH